MNKDFRFGSDEVLRFIVYINSEFLTGIVLSLQ